MGLTCWKKLQFSIKQNKCSVEQAWILFPSSYKKHDLFKCGMGLN